MFQDPLEPLESSACHQRVSRQALAYRSLPERRRLAESPYLRSQLVFLSSRAELLHPQRLVFPRSPELPGLSVPVQKHQPLWVQQHRLQQELRLRLRLGHCWSLPDPA